MVQIPSMKTAAKTTGPDQFRKVNWIDLIERNRNIYGRSKITLRLANLTESRAMQISTKF